MKLRSGKTYTFNEFHKINSKKATKKFNFKEHFTRLILYIIIFIWYIKYYSKQDFENIQHFLEKIYYLYIFPNFYDVNITRNDIFPTFKLPEDELFHSKYDFKYYMLDM